MDLQCCGGGEGAGTDPRAGQRGGGMGCMGVSEGAWVGGFQGGVLIGGVGEGSWLVKVVGFGGT